MLQSGFDALVVTLRFRIFLPGGTPGALHQGSFRPGIPLSGLATLTFASTLVVPRADADPGSQFASTREMAHIRARLCHQCRRRRLLDARYAFYQFGGGLQRRTAIGVIVDLAVQFRN